MCPKRMLEDASSGAQIQVSHQSPLKVCVLLFLSSHWWGTKCLIIPPCKNSRGASHCLGQTWKTLEYIQMLNRLSLDWTCCKLVWDRLSSSWEHNQLSYLTSNQQQELHHEKGCCERDTHTQTQGNEQQVWEFESLQPQSRDFPTTRYLGVLTVEYSWFGLVLSSQGP